MKIDDIANSDATDFEKARQAWKVWDDIEVFLDSKTNEQQELYRGRMEHTLDICNVLISNLSVSDRERIYRGA